MKRQAEEARPKPSVCRRLFSEDDPVEEGLRDNMFNQITEQINRHLDDACNKYNFDFRSEVPLEGDWTWERIVPEDNASQARARADARGPLEESEGSKETPAQPLPTSDLQNPLADEPTVPQ